MKKEINLKEWSQVLPNLVQEFLLKAACCEGEEAKLAWHEYLNRVSFDSTDYASTRLLPLVYKNFYKMGYEDPYLGRMKGIYRLTWAENKKKFQKLPGVFSALAQQGVPALLLKGAALTLLSYHDFGLRGMGDLDILVPVSRLQAARKVLTDLGWKPLLPGENLSVELHHAEHFQSEDGEDLDLHWHVLVQRCQARYDEPFWNRTQRLNYQGQEIMTLDPADHLLHACLHGALWAPSSSFRWVMDGLFLIKNCSIDWERILEMANFLGVIPTLQVTLTYLSKRFCAAIPGEVLDRLSSMESPSWQYRELKILSRPQGFFGILPVLWNRYAQEFKNSSKSQVGGSFPTYLKKYYGVGNYPDLGRFLLRKGLKKLGVLSRAS